MKKLISRIAKGQGGFTLIEMIVVVGIIAVLAAVIVPNIGKFIGSGETGAKNAEFESVQTAMNAMMADKAIIVIVASIGGNTRTSDWSGFPSGPAPAATLDGYLQSGSTVYNYCWGTDGQLVSQGEQGDGGTC